MSGKGSGRSLQSISRKGSGAGKSLQSISRSDSKAAIAAGNAANAAVDSLAANEKKKKEIVLSRPNKGVGVFTKEDSLEMHRACGFGGPHVIPRIEKVCRFH